MKKIIKLRESDINRIINKVLNEATNNTKVPYRVNEDIDPETEMRMVGKMKDSFNNMQSNIRRINFAIEEVVLQQRSFGPRDKEQLETLYRFLSRFSEDTNQATEVLKRFLQEKYY